MKLAVNLFSAAEGSQMARRWCIWLVLAAAVVPLLVWGCDRVQMIYWVGSTDLVVEFAVTDDATGTPVPGARVEVRQSKGGFYEDREEREFVLVGGADGRASRECPRSMCFGARSGLGFTDTFAVHRPYWRFRAIANGYEPGEWTDLDAPEHVRRARRAGPGKAELVVPMSLRKRHTEPLLCPPNQ